MNAVLQESVIVRAEIEATCDTISSLYARKVQLDSPYVVGRIKIAENLTSYLANLSLHLANVSTIAAEKEKRETIRLSTGDVRDLNKRTDQSDDVISISSCSIERLKNYLAKYSIDMNVGKITTLSTGSETFDRFTWMNVKERDIERAAKHLEDQLKKYGIEFGEDKYHLYDVHASKHILDVNDEKCGNLKGGTDLIVGPHGKHIMSVVQQACVAIELKASNVVLLNGGLSSFTYQALLQLISCNYYSNQLAVVMLTDLCSNATIISLAHSENNGIAVNVYENLTLSEAARYIANHLATNCEPTKSYRLHNNKRPSNEILRYFKKLRISEGIDNEPLLKLMDDTPPLQSFTERSEIIHHLAKETDIPASHLFDF